MSKIKRTKRGSCYIRLKSGKTRFVKCRRHIRSSRGYR